MEKELKIAIESLTDSIDTLMNDQHDLINSINGLREDLSKLNIPDSQTLKIIEILESIEYNTKQ